MGDVAVVRLLIADLAEVEADRLFTDEQLQTFLGLNEDNDRRAAAEALEVTARSEVLVSKKIRTQDLSTDGPAVAAELRQQAKELRAQADDDDGDDFAFEIVDPPRNCPPELTEHPVYWPWGRP